VQAANSCLPCVTRDIDNCSRPRVLFIQVTEDQFGQLVVNQRRVRVTLVIAISVTALS